MSDSSSPAVIYVSDSCFICEKDFPSDLDLAKHLIHHSKDKKFRGFLSEDYQDSDFEDKSKEISKKSEEISVGVFRQSASKIPKATKSKRVSKNSEEIFFGVVRQSTPKTHKIAVVDIFDSDDEDPTYYPTNTEKRKRSSKESKTPIRRRNSASSISTSNESVSTDLSFESKASLVKDLPSKSYHCQKCPAVFKVAQKFAEHLLVVHKKGRPHVCHICEKSFVARKTLQRHVRVHTDTKKYRCEVCGKAFAVKSKLEEHEATHDYERY